MTTCQWEIVYVGNIFLIELKRPGEKLSLEKLSIWRNVQGWTIHYKLSSCTDVDWQKDWLFGIKPQNMKWALVISLFGLFYLDACHIREKYRIVGMLVGCLPRLPRQNIHLGLPLQLSSCEARLLIEKGKSTQCICYWVCCFFFAFTNCDWNWFTWTWMKQKRADFD